MISSFLQPSITPTPLSCLRISSSNRCLKPFSATPPQSMRLRRMPCLRISSSCITPTPIPCLKPFSATPPHSMRLRRMPCLRITPTPIPCLKPFSASPPLFSSPFTVRCSPPNPPEKNFTLTPPNDDSKDLQKELNRIPDADTRKHTGSFCSKYREYLLRVRDAEKMAGSKKETHAWRRAKTARKKVGRAENKAERFGAKVEILVNFPKFRTIVEYHLMYK